MTVEMSSAEQAAHARAAGGVRQLSHRPAQRRCAQNADAARNTVRMPASMDMRVAGEDASLLAFRGVASATEREYEMWDSFGPYLEVVDATAFDETLARAGLDVPLVLSHDQLRRIARTTTGTLRLSMTELGLTVDADLDPRDADVAYIAPKIEAGLIDEMSFAFRIEAGIWSPDFTQYRITTVDLHRGDVAIVGWGANPHTSAELARESVGYGQRAAVLLDLALATGRS